MVNKNPDTTIHALYSFTGSIVLTDKVSVLLNDFNLFKLSLDGRAYTQYPKKEMCGKNIKKIKIKVRIPFIIVRDLN